MPTANANRPTLKRLSRATRRRSGISLTANASPPVRLAALPRLCFARQTDLSLLPVPQRIQYSGPNVERDGTRTVRLGTRCFRCRRTCSLRLLRVRGEVSPEALHRFPLGRHLEEAALMASRPEEEVPRKMKAWSSLDGARKARAAVAEHHSSTPKERHRLTDYLLAEVAQVYRENVALRPANPRRPSPRTSTTRPPSARRVVREARLRGLLGPARPRRGGEEGLP